MSWTRLNRPDLSVRLTRRKLARKGHPYWHLFSYGRHLGYLKCGRMRTWWIARARVVGNRYSQHRIGRTDDQNRADGVTYFSYEQATRIAENWFGDGRINTQFADAIPIGVREDLNYSPVGRIYTVGHAMMDYIAWKKLVAANSYLQTLVTLANFHIIPRLGMLPAEEFNGEHLREFVRDVLETPPKCGNAREGARRSVGSLDEESLRKRKGTVNTLIGVLRSAMRMAWENGKIENSRGWQTLRRIPNVSRVRLLHLSRPECRKLLAHCKPDLARLVRGALYTGCRITELLRMQACDVGRDGYGVYVKPSKTYKPRFVFLPDEGMMFFLSLAGNRSPGDLLFLRDNGKDWYFYQRHAFKQAVQAADLPLGFSFHGLRHTYASQLIQAGAPLIVVSEQLGHANITCVSQTYGHLSPQIRESEVRQRYTSIDSGLAHAAANQKKSLERWRKSLHGGDWRSYASITDVRSKSRTR